MITKTVLPIACTLFLALLGCDKRPVALEHEDGGGTLSDARPSSADACHLPVGACFSASDCIEGSACVGCDGDPCCPTCTVCVGQCMASCRTSADCTSDQYCHVENGCEGGAERGVCTPRPPIGSHCYANEVPICGCDGKEYACTDAAHAAGTNVTNELVCMSCGELNAAYRAAVSQAKTCTRTLAQPQCTKLVDADLMCGCPTFVTPANTSFAQLEKIRTEFQTRNCPQPDCMMACPQDPLRGECSPSDRCQDVF